MIRRVFKGAKRWLEDEGLDGMHMHNFVILYYILSSSQAHGQECNEIKLQPHSAHIYFSFLSDPLV